MKSIVRNSLLLVLLLALIGPALIGTSVEAQNGEFCYAVADNDTAAGDVDQLVSLNKFTGEVTTIGAPGTLDIEAIAFATDGKTLYAADGGQLGTLNLTTAAFTPFSSPVGTGTGVAGSVNFDDLDGLTFDPSTGELYGTQRRTGSADDVLIKIDKTTGEYVPNAFGPGEDYVVMSGADKDIDDIAVDPVTGTMYAVSNSGGIGGFLVTVDRSSGATTVIGALGVDDVEGLSFFNDGQLYGSTGDASEAPADVRNTLYTINKTTAVASNPLPFTQYTDYEALGCLTGEPNSVGLAGIGVSNSNGIGSNLGMLLGLTALVGFTAIVVWRRVTPFQA